MSSLMFLFFFFFSSRRRHTRSCLVSWARRCVQETGTWREPRGIEIPSEITWEFVQNELTKKETQEKKELELKIEKEHEIQMEKRKVELEEKYKKQEEERLTQIEQQKQQYDKTIEDIKQKNGK
eukprot:TRINITY_DN11764_c0_g1_i3.p4 TRINITY_DN11764_c0_g1~~TRINITY_DN11764_c0_g1_i3.p4  ORF type:complete len:124 (-),score=44.99 TRINITY_DN11764_c0_g1_i3:87-458(-)